MGQIRYFKAQNQHFGTFLQFCVLDISEIVTYEKHWLGTQPAIAWSKLTTETLEQGVKYVQS